MSKFGELIVSTVLPIVKQVGIAEITDLLYQIKQHNMPEIYQETLQGLNSTFKLLKEVALTTNTKIDEGIVDMVLEAVQASAAANGITLT